MYELGDVLFLHSFKMKSFRNGTATVDVKHSTLIDVHIVLRRKSVSNTVVYTVKAKKEFE